INQKRKYRMKRLSLAAVGVAIALSLGAQTTPDEKKQEPAQPEAKAKAEQNTKADEKKTSTGAATKQDERVKTGSNEREGAQVEQGGKVSYSTTVFRNGRNSTERLALHRTFRERTDIHFGMGSHDRLWWLGRYSIVLVDGCHYYLADDGCWYPAYGFDRRCNYPAEVVYCQ
ncbi:MAG TPA: hypothetical protein VGH08_11080, partial [Chthoniobacterales bacterium]